MSNDSLPIRAITAEPITTITVAPKPSRVYKPLVDSFDVAQQRLETAVTFNQKGDGLKAASLGIAELNIQRMRTMLTLMAAVEESLVDKIITEACSSDQVMAVYNLLHRASVTANTQIKDTLKMVSDEKLIGLFLTPALPEDEEGNKETSIIDIQLEAGEILKDLNKL